MDFLFIDAEQAGMFDVDHYEYVRSKLAAECRGCRNVRVCERKAFLHGSARYNDGPLFGAHILHGTTPAKREEVKEGSRNWKAQ
jgi:hypothetical protein